MLPIECGLFGICGHQLTKENNVELVYHGLSKLQHRGQDSYGYAYMNKDNQITQKHHSSLVNMESIDTQINNFSDLTLIGHLRYKTSGKISDERLNIQPFYSDLGFSLAHNGNIKDTTLLKETLLKIKPDLDPKILHLLKERNHDTLYLLKIIEYLPAELMEDKLVQLMNLVPGVYCLLILMNNAIYIARDKYGVRPLSLATMEINGKTQYMVASESVSFPGEYYLVRDVNPGEVLKMSTQDGFDTVYQVKEPILRHCLFEYIYFLQPETHADGLTVSNVRNQYGVLLAEKEHEIMKSNIIKYEQLNQYPIIDKQHNICIINPVNYEKPEQYIVVGSPSSGILAAQGYAKTMKLVYQQIIVKQKNIRSFILNNDAARRKACYEKFKFIKENIEGKKIILVDDSLVRGNTTRIMVQVLKELGAIEVHVRIASPPIKNPCYFGIDIPTSKELIAHEHDLYSVTRIIGADSLIYLDLHDIQSVHNNTMCHACFSGQYESGLLSW